MLGSASDPEDLDGREMPPEPGTLESVPSGCRRNHVAHPDDLRPLLDLATEVGVDLALTAVIDACVEHLGGIFREHRVGLAVAPATGAEKLVARSAADAAPVPRGIQGSRLFPGQPFERVICLPGVPDSTLHVAGSDSALAERGWDRAGTLEEAAKVVALLVERALFHEQTSRNGMVPVQVEAKLLQAQRLATLGQIVAGVAHEINNPLTSILAYVEMLRRPGAAGPREPPDLERLRRIEESAQRILKFTRDVVAYARPSSPVPAPVCLADSIGKALVFCEHEFTQHGVVVEYDPETRVPPVLGVAGQLIQVFVNLFTNASHAMREPGGRLRIAAEAGPQTARIEVSDTGIGIEPCNLSRVFDRFFTTRVDGGGLGLSIVRDIVTAHGGRLELSSAPGRGTTFVLTLPLAPSARTEPPPR